MKQWIGCSQRVRVSPQVPRSNLGTHADTLTQGQMAQLWGENVTQQNLSKALGLHGQSFVKKTYGYQERDPIKRQEFLERLKTFTPQSNRLCR